MVFGNMGDTSATGVAFTRSPTDGQKVFYGEYLINAQGEDVVAGIRTPQQISNAGKEAQGSKLPSMEESMPQMYKELLQQCFDMIKPEYLNGWLLVNGIFGNIAKDLGFKYEFKEGVKSIFDRFSKNYIN